MKKRKWILLVIILLILAGVAAAGASLRIETVVYEGNERISDDELDSRIFTGEMDRNPLVFYYKTKYQEQPAIPFVDEYDVEMNSLKSVTITVYEKNMIGCVKYMGSYLYFDKDGIVVESSDKKQEDIVLVTGISFDYFVLDEKLPVKKEHIFDQVLVITQQLEKYGIFVERLNISADMEISLYWENIVVDLGADDDTMNDKIVDLNDMMENLKGLSGTLDMREYNTNGTGYTFRKRK